MKLKVKIKHSPEFATKFKHAEKMNETERVGKKQIINNQTHFDYDKEHDLLYVSLKTYPNHYVDQLEGKYFDLWRNSETDEIVGAHIWNASKWFKMILKTAEEHSTIKPDVTKNTSITNEETAKHCIYNDGTFYCRLTGDCCVCLYNRKVCFDGKLKEENKNDT